MSNHEDLRRHRQAMASRVEQVSEQPETVDSDTFRPSLTISRTAGARAVTIARELVDYLGNRDENAEHGWALYDKNLVQTIIQDHRLPVEICRYMPEDSVNLLQNYLELISMGTTDQKVFGWTVETVRKLGHLGHTIIVGRGANLINRELPNCYHVRLVGSEACRLKHLQSFYDLGLEEATAWMHKQDAGRRRYVRAHFGEDIENPLLYHLIINTDHHPDDFVVRFIGDSLLAWAEVKAKGRKKSVPPEHRDDHTRGSRAKSDFH